MKKVFLLAMPMFLVAALGCGSAAKLHEVEGQVTLDGQPLADASVTFTPDGTGTPAHAQTDKDGVYRLTTGMQPGVMSGSYKVTVTKDDTPPMDPNWTPQQKMDARLKASKSPAKSLVPKAYTAATSTPLHCSVPVENGKLDLELKQHP